MTNVAGFVSCLLGVGHSLWSVTVVARWFMWALQKMFPVSGSGWTRAIGMQLRSSDVAAKRVAQFALGGASWSSLSVSPSVCISLSVSPYSLSVSASVCISCLLPLSLFPGHQECLCLSSSTCTRTSTQHPLPPKTALVPLHIHSLPTLPCCPSTSTPSLNCPNAPPYLPPQTALVPKLPSYPLQPPSNERADFS